MAGPRHSKSIHAITLTLPSVALPIIVHEIVVEQITAVLLLSSAAYGVPTAFAVPYALELHLIIWRWLRHSIYMSREMVLYRTSIILESKMHLG